MTDTLTLLQGVRGLLNVIEGLNGVDVKLIDEESAALCEEMFDGDRERGLLSDEEILSVIRAIYRLCETHPTFLQIMSTNTVGGSCTVEAEGPIEIE